jgi:parallel beta-helix repeat protein
MRSFDAKSFKSSSALDLKNHSQLVILSSGKLSSVLRWLSMLVAAGLTLYAATCTWNVHSIAPASAEGVGCAIMALFSIMLLTGALVTRRRSDSGVVGAYAGVFGRGVAEVLSFIPQGLSSNLRQKGMFFCLFLLAAMTSGLSAQSCASPPVHNINTGLHYCTIQAAIDAPQTVSGHTITVDAGTYQEALAITKAVALRGPNASISPNGGVRVPEAIIDLTTGTRSIRMFSSNVNITGFEIRNSANAGAIIAGQFNEVNSNPTNVVIERNYFHDLNGSAIVHFAPPSSAAWTVNDNRIENVTEGAYYGGTYGSGVQFWTGANCVVSNNVISNVAHYGIHLGNISNSTFNGNHISNCNGAAIQGFGTFNGNTFSDNELVRSSLPLSTDGIRILSAPTSITITNNYIAGYANGVLIGAGQPISGTFTLTNNNLAGNTYGLYHGGTGTVSAPCNWWGEVCSTVSQKVFGPVTLETILNSGTDTDLALRGFQPAAGTCVGVPQALVLTATPSATSCSVPTGTVSLSASGGTSPYTYGGDAISGLAAGTYSYTVVDNLGCNASATATINNETTGTPEVCDGIDNDCDGSIDEGLVFMNYYADADGDGFGNPSESVSSCTAPSGYVVDNTDCNDSNAAINPGAAEVCDGIDNDCDGSIDEGLVFMNYYADADGDGFGNPSESVSSCTAPSGYVVDNTDCDDSNAAINPGAAEVCDGIDNNCDGVDDNGPCSTNGCTYLNAANYNPSATTDDGSCIFSGCTDPLALNFSGLANSDDGSCLYGGCTDPSATNYSAIADVNDGSCLYSGCTNPLATNYCALADVDDGSCIVPVHGCTYVAAPNYNPLATVDDGSCLCEANTCTSDVDGNGVVNVSDVLLVMSEFGLVCP